MYDVTQVRDTLISAVEGGRPDEEWLRAVEASPVDGEEGTFGLNIDGQEFFITVEAA